MAKEPDPPKRVKDKQGKGEQKLPYPGRKKKAPGDRESTRRLSDSGKGIGTDLVDEAHSLGQSHIVTGAVGRRSSTTLAYAKRDTQLALEKPIPGATKREVHLPPT